MTAFLDEMDLLAAEIAKAARAAATALDIKIDAFKALTPYYAHQMKNKDKDDPEDDDLPNFGNFQSRIHAVAEIDDGADESGVRGDRRRRAASEN